MRAIVYTEYGSPVDCQPKLDNFYEGNRLTSAGVR